MEKRIKNYRSYMDGLLKDWAQKTSLTREEAAAQEEEHLRQISFFQHERLIHLIVTVTFALLEMLALILFFVSQNLFTLLLIAALLILLIPYIRHYYILENEVQRMYEQYDRLHRFSQNNL